MGWAEAHCEAGAHGGIAVQKDRITKATQARMARN